MKAIKPVIRKLFIIFLVIGCLTQLSPAMSAEINPLQSINEAKQVIDQARRAGAEQKALDDLMAADSWLSQAQNNYRYSQSLMSMIGTAKMKQARDDEVIFSATMAQLKGRIATTKAKNVDAAAALKKAQTDLADYRSALAVMKKKIGEADQAQGAQAQVEHERLQLDELKRRTMDLESQKRQELEEVQKKSAELAALKEKVLRETQSQEAKQAAAKEKEIGEAKLRSEMLEVQRAKEELERKAGEQKLSEEQQKNFAMQAKMRAIEREMTMFTEAGNIPNVTAKMNGKKIILTMLATNLFSPANELKTAGKEILSTVGALLTEYSDNKVIVQGHTDSRGKPALNQVISERWAQKVREYLVAYKNILPARIKAEGLGAAQPVASNNNEAGRSLNRRLEVIILMPTS